MPKQYMSFLSNWDATQPFDMDSYGSLGAASDQDLRTSASARAYCASPQFTDLDGYDLYLP